MIYNLPPSNPFDKDIEAHTPEDRATIIASMMERIARFRKARDAAPKEKKKAAPKPISLDTRIGE